MRYLIFLLSSSLVLLSCKKEINLNNNDLYRIAAEPQALYDFMDEWKLKECYPDPITTKYCSSNSNIILTVTPGDGYTLEVRSTSWSNIEDLKHFWMSQYEHVEVQVPEYLTGQFDPLGIHSINYFSSDSMDVLFASKVSENDEIYFVSVGIINSKK